MRRTFLIILLGLTNVHVLAQDARQTDDHGHQKSRVARRDQTQTADDEHSEWQRAKKLMTFGTAPDSPRASVSLEELAKGAVGYFEMHTAEISSIFGPTDSLLATGDPQLPYLWLCDYPTDELTPGSKVRLVGLVTRDGTRTIQMKQGDEANVPAIRILTEQQTTRHREALEEQSRYRTWTYRPTGSTVLAKLVRYNGDSVALQPKDHKIVITLQLQSLSADDQQYVFEMLRP